MYTYIYVYIYVYEYIREKNIFADEEGEFWQQQGEGGHIAGQTGENHQIAGHSGENPHSRRSTNVKILGSFFGTKLPAWSKSKVQNSLCDK